MKKKMTTKEYTAKMEELRLLHYRMWDWLSKNPGKRKYEWAEWARNGGALNRVSGWCFACVACEMTETHQNLCDLTCRITCPIKDWGEGTTNCMSDTSLFHIWQHHTNQVDNPHNTIKESASTKARCTEVAESIRDAWKKGAK